MAIQEEETPSSIQQAESSTVVEQACEDEWLKYRKKFPSVPYMTSKELRQIEGEEDIMLVDVRTKAEQKVSMLPNSMTLDEWKASVLPKLNQAASSEDGSNKKQEKIVFYCTIGYRSGVEAKKFQEAYPDLTFYSLDGIVPYTHTAKADDLPLVHRQNNTPTKRGHVFGSAWSKYANPEFELVVFSKTHFLIEGVAVKFKHLFGGAKAK